jgi:hypothetical protein
VRQKIRSNPVTRGAIRLSADRKLPAKNLPALSKTMGAPAKAIQRTSFPEIGCGTVTSPMNVAAPIPDSQNVYQQPMKKRSGV